MVGKSSSPEKSEKTQQTTALRIRKSRAQKCGMGVEQSLRRSTRLQVQQRDAEDEKINEKSCSLQTDSKQKSLSLNSQVRFSPRIRSEVANSGMNLQQRRRENVEDNNIEKDVTEKNAHTMVKKSLRLYNQYYLHFVQEAEKICRKMQIDKKGKPVDLTNKIKSLRPNLKAASKMLENNEILYPIKRIGNLPGVDVGHRFYSRAEMAALGFHSQWLSGIDYMGKSCKTKEYSNYTLPLAVAIVVSGMYEDDLDNSDDIIYTGQGGNNLQGNKRQVQDQVLERGNMALKNNADQGLPVRVVRGHVFKSSHSSKVYTYDGLYNVVQYWQEKGLSGYNVFKFRLRRLDGQPPLTTKQVQFAFGNVRKSISDVSGLVCQDISGGLEPIPILATNIVDDPPVAPSGFTYTKSIKVVESLVLPETSSGCSCKNVCVEAKCSCAALNGSEFSYVQNGGGRLIEAKDIVFECGLHCGCGTSCLNRTSQRGIKYRFEVFRTLEKGWAVRSWDFIPSGAFICEYVGELKRIEDVESVTENSYIFEIDCVQTMMGIDGRERRSKDARVANFDCLDVSKDYTNDNAPEFCIDAYSSGNFARFINHSCEPNLFVQCVLSSHRDPKLAQVMLFAADNIPPFQELTYDYGYALDSVHSPDGEVIQMPCYCGAADCRKRFY